MPRSDRLPLPMGPTAATWSAANGQSTPAPSPSGGTGVVSVQTAEVRARIAPGRSTIDADIEPGPVETVATRGGGRAVELLAKAEATAERAFVARGLVVDGGAKGGVALSIGQTGIDPAIQMLLLLDGNAERCSIGKDGLDFTAIAPLLAHVALNVGAQEGAICEGHVAEEGRRTRSGPGRKGVLLLITKDVFESLPTIVGIADRTPQIELGPGRTCQIKDLPRRQTGDDPRRVEIVAIVVAPGGVGWRTVAAVVDSILQRGLTPSADHGRERIGIEVRPHRRSAGDDRPVPAAARLVWIECNQRVGFQIERNVVLADEAAELHLPAEHGPRHADDDIGKRGRLCRRIGKGLLRWRPQRIMIGTPQSAGREGGEAGRARAAAAAAAQHLAIDQLFFVLRYGIGLGSARGCGHWQSDRALRPRIGRPQQPRQADQRAYDYRCVLTIPTTIPHPPHCTLRPNAQRHTVA